MKTIADLHIGERAFVKEFRQVDLSLKLLEMGCLPGEIVRVNQIALLGGPISINVAGYQLSLRVNEANMIWVEQIDEQ